MRFARAVRVGLLLASAAPLVTGCVTVAEQRKMERRLNERIDRMEAGEDGASRLADLAARLEGIEQELARLTGRVEVVEHRAEEAVEQARTAREEAARSGAPPPPPSGEAGPGAASDADSGASAAELEAYRAARTAWSDGDTEACIDRFRNFLQTYPSSSYAENASYWMADCYFKQGDYKTAVLRFDDVVARFPKSTRAPDALYRQGEALLRLGPGYGKAAGKAFERVIDEYPNSAQAQEAKKQLELLGSG